MSIVHWVFVEVAGLLFGPILLYLLFRASLARRYASMDPGQAFISGVGTLLAFFAGAVATGSEVWKPRTWDNPQTNILLPVACVSLFIGLAAVGKMLENASKVFVSADIAALKRHRDRAIYTSALFRQVITHKLERLYKLRSSNAPFEQKAIIEALRPAGQLQYLLQTAHEFLAQRKHPSAQLRVGLYTKLEAKPELGVSFSWDGTTTDCFKNNQSEYMELDGPEAKTAVVRCFRGDQSLVIYEDCEVAAKNGDFEYFKPEQRNYIKSMALYRHIFKPSTSGQSSKIHAMVLAFDSSQKGFFKQNENEELASFFVDLMHRVEYEFAVLALVNDSKGEPPVSKIPGQVSTRTRTRRKL